MNFLKLQLLIVYRLMKGLGIIVSVLLLCVAGLLLYILSLAPQTNIILVDAALVAGFHYSRGDRELLQILYGSEKRLLMAEYVLLSTPFIAVCALRLYWLPLLMCLAIAIALPMLPRPRLQFTMFTFPFLLKGSYQYAGSMRTLLIPYLLGIFASCMGLLYHNINITYATLLLFVYLLGFLICQPVRKSHLMFYSSPLRMIHLQSIYAIGNTFALLCPFFAILLIHKAGALAIGEVVMIYILATLFLFQSELIRYFKIDNPIVIMIVLSALFMVDAIGYMKTVMIPLAAFTTLLLSFMVYSKYSA